MKKIVSILAIVLAFTMMMTVSSFAAASFAVAEGADYDTEATTVTPAADSIAVTTASTAGNYYGILLVTGDALPTVDNAILYIDQATAADVTQAFTVLPNMTGLAAGTELTLYISSNVAGAELIAIPMVYAEEAEGPTYTLGDVNGDGEINVTDVVAVVNNILKGTGFEADEAAADVNADGEINVTDVVAIVNNILKGTEF